MRDGHETRVWTLASLLLLVGAVAVACGDIEVASGTADTGSPPADVVADVSADAGADVVADGVPAPDAGADLAGPDVPADVVGPDVPTPPGCCETEEDCAPAWVCSGGAPGSPHGVCREPAPGVACWADAECADGEVCDGLSTCGCRECGMMESRGECKPVDAACEPNEQLTFHLGVLRDENTGEPWAHEGTIVVVGHGLAAVATVNNLRQMDVVFLDDGIPLTIVYRLPANWSLPIRVGERLFLVADVRPWFEGTDVMLEFHNEEGGLRARLVDSNWEPRWADTPCEPAPGDCGRVQHGAVDIDLGPRASVRLEQGEIGGYEADGERFRVALAKVYENVTMDCLDYPNAYIQLAVLAHQGFSQCVCADGYDCALGEVCETEVHRCVEELCTAESCGDEKTCDPFTGCIELPPSALQACLTSADCDSRNPVCNPGLGFCQEDWCATVDCDGGFCSPLLRDCVDCLSHCDCPGAGCHRDSRRCSGPCAVEKFNLHQDNDERWDYYVLCLPRNGVDPAIELQGIDPTIQCEGGLFPGCDGLSDASCMGELGRPAEDGSISIETWETLCRLSRVPWVQAILGGHYLD